MEGESTRITNFCRMFYIKEASGWPVGHLKCSFLQYAHLLSEIIRNELTTYSQNQKLNLRSSQENRCSGVLQMAP